MFPQVFSRHVLVGSVTLAVVLPAHAEPSVQHQVSYYYIDGGSALVLSEQMNQKGPQGSDGKHHPARTRWEVQWKFRHNVHEGSCRMEQVAVALGITTTRPRWRGEKKAPAALRERWDSLMQAIDRNQAFQKQQAVEAASAIEKALLSAKPTKTCEALTESANKAASAILEKHKTASEEYDRKDRAALI
jgi:predicted secreted Zn-dependent protease